MSNREEKIIEVMESLDDTWVSLGGVPSIYKIIKESERILNSAADKVKLIGEYEVQSGGLRAESYYSEEEGFDFRLSFILTEWRTFD